MFQLVDYSLKFIDLSWQWLNDPEIKKLTMTKDFTREEQMEFYNRLPDRSDYWIRGIQYESQPIGVMGIKNITKESGEYWGYIGDKRYWGKGFGAQMLTEAVLKSRQLLLAELYLRVAAYNTRAKSLYQKFGFVFNGSENGVERYSLSL